MHRTFVFGIKCESPQIPLKNPQVVNTELGAYITEDLTFGHFPAEYDAFNTIEIIPDLLKIVEKIKQNKTFHENTKNTNLVKKWVKKWGFLKAERVEIADNKIYGQHVGQFIDEAFKFYDLWTLYSISANRDLEKLKEVATIVKVDDLPYAATHLYTFFGEKHYGDTLEGIFREEDPLKSYQMEAMTYIGSELEPYINQNKMYWASLSRESSNNQDHYKFTPALGFNDLLDALYMQFFILLNENTKKICPICNQPFTPDRVDQVYCTDSCKLTAKSRRYRARRKSII